MKRIFMIFAATAAIVSCGKVEEMIQPQAPEVTITAEHLKTVINNTGAVTWDGNEEISVLFRKDGEFHIEKYENANAAGEIAKFVGTIKSHVTTENGWNNAAYCVCPSTSVDDNTGKVMHSLPAEQYAHASAPGSFETGLNLSYAPLSLKAIEESSQGQTMFQNALSVLRLVPGSDDITSITINASDPLVGEAPMVFDSEGKLVIDSDGTWGESSNSVVLRPSENNECFTKGVTYNILVYPGAHTSFSVTLNYKEYGDYTKRLKSAPTFAPAKYYTIGFTSDSEVIITEMSKDVEYLENNLPSLDELKENVEALLEQVQSVTLFTEYLDNAAYAPYSALMKNDLVLDYIIKPESAAEALVEAFKTDKSLVSAVATYKPATEYVDLAVKSLELSAIEGVGKFVTATINANNISDNFYNGTQDALVALHVKSGATDLMSDFAKLVPKVGSGLGGNYLENIPSIPGARVVIPFKFSVSDSNLSYTFGISGENVASAYFNNSDNELKTGNFSVVFKDEVVANQKVTLTLNVGDGVEVISQDFTFVDSGANFTFVDPGKVDYIGGDVVINPITTNIKNYMLSCSGAGISQEGNIFSFTENDGSERTATVECKANIQGVSLEYYKSITLTQNATGTQLTKSYYTNGQKVVLNQANASGCSNYFNIVILGDGYKKKDLAVGGKFERSARSAMDSFFAIEPYKSFKDRFNVYMVAYESVDEGTYIKSSGVEKNTYFGSYCQGGNNTAAYVADTAPVIKAVKAVVGSADAQYYRSIAILLINTNEQAGSTGYPFRDSKSGFVNGYASFAIAALAANSTGTNGLVKHEAGGHAFGRLADEYYTFGNRASSDNQKYLSNWHAKGWYWNVNPSDSGNYYKFTNTAYSSSEVSYIEGAWGYEYGIFRPTQGGMMQGSTGVFNAPSRHAIYHRIITESEDANAYSWSKFLEYDQKNR